VLDESFGIPPEMKSWLQEEALEYMGENKASYLTKAAIDKIPEGDQKVWRYWLPTNEEYRILIWHPGAQASPRQDQGYRWRSVEQSAWKVRRQHWGRLDQELPIDALWRQVEEVAVVELWIFRTVAVKSEQCEGNRRKRVRL
jgi:hypothetical protein